MGARYSFIAIFPLLLVALGLWSHRIERAQQHPQEIADLHTLESNVTAHHGRRELLETLDRMVAYEHYYRSVYGHFTQLLGRVGILVPSEVGSSFDIRVADATPDRLLITALSEIQGNVSDLVSVDENYEVHANFPIPLPRQDYLRMKALKHLRALREAPEGLGVEEQGIFRGFFRYEVRQDSQSRKIAFAVGIRPPVVGMQVEFGPSQSAAFALESPQDELALVSELDEASEALPTMTGQKADGEVMSSGEEAFLAQRIFHGEVGRYAKTWSELSRIANFQFREKNRLPSPGIPRAPGFAQSAQSAQSNEKTRIAEIDFSELKSQETSRKPASAATGLEIEPILSDE